MRLITSVLARVAALVAVVAVLVGVPLVALRLTGALSDASPSSSWTTGRLDDGAVLQIAAVVFLGLWGWFAAVAVSETVAVMRHRRSPRTVGLRPVPASPAGWVRRLVRVVLLSSGAIVGPLAAGVITPMARPGLHVAEAMAPGAPVRMNEMEIRSNGRDTPYSVAVRLGDATLRDRIIELNHGRETPAGGRWTGGVFPGGMRVFVPEGALRTQQVTWVPYPVREGDSVYRIAAMLANGENRRVRELADLIIDRNMGNPMSDGRLFDDPSLLRVGWEIEVPLSAGSTAPAEVRAHIVERGESYWAIAEDVVGEEVPAAVAHLTTELVETNAPRFGRPDPTLLLVGDEVLVPIGDSAPLAAPPVPAPAPAPAPVPASPVETSEPPATPVLAQPAWPAPQPANVAASRSEGTTTSSIVSGLGGAVLLGAGSLGAVELRRRARLRRATSRSFVPAPAPEVVATERLLRTLDATDRALRLDLALRSAGHRLVGTGGYVIAAILTDEGDVTLLLDRSTHVPSAPWHLGAQGRWRLDAAVDDRTLIETARLAGQPCPALVHLGALLRDGGAPGAGDVFVDLEALGLLSIDGPDVERSEIIRAITASLGLSPVGETLHLVTHGLDDTTDLGGRSVQVDTLDAALDAAAALIGSVPAAGGQRRTFELRARGVGGEAWEPAIVVSAAPDIDGTIDREVLAMATGGRGLAVVVGRPLAGAPMRLTARADGWMLDPLGLLVLPSGVSAADVRRVRDLLDDVDRSLPIAAPSTVVTLPLDPFEEAPWSLVVRLLGPVGVSDRDGVDVIFERGKALELVAWMVGHRGASTRSAARAALWELDVRDATFSNVVSDARRALARTASPPAGDEWIGRTLTEHLPLHPLVVSDADLLRARLDGARGRSPREAIAVLRPGVELIAGMPFTGTDYLWPDAEGITSSLVVLATSAAAELARQHLALDDIEGVFWATGRGLAVLGGHEELIALRMRAHATRGNLAGVRHEWEFYERALDADPWSSGDPSPTLLSLRRELLAG
ncbi:MAG: hypothetical protein ACOYL9_04630 [Ilumatobacteraceae bacterium]